MMILGFHGGSKRDDEDNRSSFALHDSAAVLLDDGRIVAAIEEERLNRIKHSNCFPLRAITSCLNQYRIGLRDVDWIATNFEASTVDYLAKLAFLENPATNMPAQARSYVATLFQREFGVDVADKIQFCKHHLAHAWSAFGLSGYSHSLILVLDGEGDNRSGMVLVGDGSQITKLREYSTEQSLGELYVQVIKLLGYNRFDEYKVMGLAPYGNPNTYAPVFEQFYRLLPEGNYELQKPITIFAYFDEVGLLTKARRKGEPFTQMHKDVAASLQVTLEKIVIHILEHYSKLFKRPNLCLAGGVAHNCTMNGKILYSGMFRNVFVQPAAHDAGGALGAALSVLVQKAPAVRLPRLEHLYFGTDAGDDSSICTTLSTWSEFLTCHRVSNVTEKAAQLLASGSVIGWVQGRSEFGPRALGNRSILADPRPPENKDLINQMVKKRESYRPFAPSVLEENLSDFFDVPSKCCDFPFMIFVLKVREEMRARLGAVTHVDGTARVHTVSRTTNPKYWELIREFGKITGIPIVLNTSFNNHAEPIVDSIEDAIACLLTTGIDYLVLGDYLVTKKNVNSSAKAYKNLIPNMPQSRRLVSRKSQVAMGRYETVFEVESTTSPIFSQPVLRVSETLFSILRRHDGKRSIGQLLDEILVIDEDEARHVIDDIVDLWSKRAVILRPPNS
jgi:carbamoyltransferase